jgi:ABC-type xylose transport system permease subunit
LGLYQRRDALRNGRLVAAIRPLIEAALVLGVALYFSWSTLGGRQLGIGVLHLGFVLMLGTVWFVDWFLNRTTPGFALRTVGANPNAARYAGMNVKWNLILALMMSGALAGLAGAIELSSVAPCATPAAPIRSSSTFAAARCGAAISCLRASWCREAAWPCNSKPQLPVRRSCCTPRS